MKPLDKHIKIRPKTTIKFREAEEALNIAIDESQKPLENVVVFTVCSNSTKAARLLLEGYLQTNNISFDENIGFADLLTLCKKKNSNFKNFDTHAFECQANIKTVSNYCLDIDRANKCLELALDLEQFLRSKSANLGIPKHFK